MSNLTLRIPLMLILLVALTSCTKMPVEEPTPGPTIVLPASLLNGRWKLVEAKLDAQSVDMQSIAPVYLTIQTADDNTYRITFQSECYANHESPRRDAYIIQFATSSTFKLIAESHEANQCDPEREPQTKIFAELRNQLTTYTIDNKVLLLRGVDQKTGQEITMSWVQES